MLQTLLANRFKLQLHRESRDFPVYWLVVGRNGPRVPKAMGEAGSFHIARGSLSGHTAMTALANVFSNWLDRQVLDRTDLKGVFEITLEWIPDDQTSPESAFQPGASLFLAVQQLGLKLEPRKGSVGILVIDGAEKPSEN